MSYKITCLNEKYDGESASVKFEKGVGKTDSDYLASWFRSHGYKVEEIKEKSEKTTIDNGEEKANRNELIKKCKEFGIPTEKTDTVESLTAKLNAFIATTANTTDEAGGVNE